MLIGIEGDLKFSNKGTTVENKRIKGSKQKTEMSEQQIQIKKKAILENKSNS